MDFHPTTIVIKWKPEHTLEEVSTILSVYGIISNTIPQARRALLTLKAGITPEQAVKELKSNPDIEHVELNIPRSCQFLTSNDPFASNNNNPYDAIFARDAWSLTTGSPDVTVAVLDTGIDTTHPDLGNYSFGKVWANGLTPASNGSFPIKVSIQGLFAPDIVPPGTEIDVTIEDGINATGPIAVIFWDQALTLGIPFGIVTMPSDGSDVVFYITYVVRLRCIGTVRGLGNYTFRDVGLLTMKDTFGHGTATSGCVAATINNDIGIAGIAGTSKIAHYIVGGADGEIFTFPVCQSIYDAVDRGYKIISMSFGGMGYSTTEEEACEYAYGAGCCLVAASGNNSFNSLATTNAGKVILTGTINANAGDTAFYDLVGNSTFFSLAYISKVVHVDDTTILYLYFIAYSGNLWWQSILDLFTSFVSGVSRLSISLDTNGDHVPLILGTDFTINSITPHDILFYPASYDNVISVSGTGYEQRNYTQRASFAQYGDFVNIAAPATSIFCTTPTYPCPMLASITPPYNGTSPYWSLDGTSFSTPIVAGAIALMYSLKPDSTPLQIKTALYTSATTNLTGTGGLPQSGMGAGLLNIKNALDVICGSLISAGLTSTSTLVSATLIGSSGYFGTSMEGWIFSSGDNGPQGELSSGSRSLDKAYDGDYSFKVTTGYYEDDLNGDFYTTPGYLTQEITTSDGYISFWANTENSNTTLSLLVDSVPFALNDVGSGPGIGTADDNWYEFASVLPIVAGDHTLIISACNDQEEDSTYIDTISLPLALQIITDNAISTSSLYIGELSEIGSSLIQASELSNISNIDNFYLNGILESDEIIINNEINSCELIGELTTNNLYSDSDLEIALIQVLAGNGSIRSPSGIKLQLVGGDGLPITIKRYVRNTWQ
jgi:subtilisin family serine protease